MSRVWYIEYSGCSVNVLNEQMTKQMGTWAFSSSRTEFQHFGLSCRALPVQTLLTFPDVWLHLSSMHPALQPYQASRGHQPHSITHAGPLYEALCFIALHGGIYVRPSHSLLLEAKLSLTHAGGVHQNSCFINLIIIPGHMSVSPIDSTTKRLEGWNSAPLFGFTVSMSNSDLA